MVDIKIIENQTEDNCHFVMKVRPQLYKYVLNPSKETSILAMRGDGNNLKWYKGEDEDVFIEAVRNNGNAIKFVKKQTKKVAKEALKNTRQCFKFIDQSLHDDEICDLAMEDSASAWNIHYMKQTETRCEKAITLNPSTLNIIQDKTDRLLYLACKYTNDNLTFNILFPQINEKTDEMVMEFLPNHCLVFRYLKDRNFLNLCKLIAWHGVDLKKYFKNDKQLMSVFELADFHELNTIEQCMSALAAGKILPSKVPEKFLCDDVYEIMAIKDPNQIPEDLKDKFLDKEDPKICSEKALDKLIREKFDQYRTRIPLNRWTEERVKMIPKDAEINRSFVQIYIPDNLQHFFPKWTYCDFEELTSHEDIVKYIKENGREYGSEGHLAGKLRGFNRSQLEIVISCIPGMVEYLDNVDEQLALLAINSGYTQAIHYVENPDLSLIYRCLKDEPLNIRFIDQRQLIDDDLYKCIRRNPSCIEYIHNPTEKMWFVAISLDSSLIREHPTQPKDLVLYGYKKTEKFCKDSYIELIRDESMRLFLLADNASEEEIRIKYAKDVEKEEVIKYLNSGGVLNNVQERFLTPEIMKIGILHNWKNLNYMERLGVSDIIEIAKRNPDISIPENEYRDDIEYIAACNGRDFCRCRNIESKKISLITRGLPFYPSFKDEVSEIFPKLTQEQQRQCIENSDRYSVLNFVESGILKKQSIPWFFERLKKEEEKEENQENYVEPFYPYEDPEKAAQLFHQDPVEYADYFQYVIEETSEEEKASVMRVMPENIKYVNNPSLKVMLEALTADLSVYRWLVNPPKFIKEWYKNRIK